MPIFFLLLALVALPAWADCPLDLGRGGGWVVYSSRYMIAFRPDPVQVEVGAPFSLVMNICTKGGEPAELVAVEAQMPERRDGRNFKPIIVPGQDGRYRAKGMVFPVSGRWEIDFDVRSGGEIERLSHDMLLE